MNNIITPEWISAFSKVTVELEDAPAAGRPKTVYDIAQELYDLLLDREWEHDEQYGNCCLSCGVCSKKQGLSISGIPKHEEDCKFVKAIKAFESLETS